MDGLPGLTTLIPSAGVFGCLVYLFIHIMRQSSSDRKQYTDNLFALRTYSLEEMRLSTERHEKEIQALRERYDSEIRELREELKALQQKINELWAELENERRARHRAEEEAARYRRTYGDINGGVA